MPNFPHMNYRILDTTELGDLVIWTEQNCSRAYLGSFAIRESMQKLLGAAMGTKYFSGPLGCQVAFDPAERPPAELPLVVHIYIGPLDATKAFLYLDESITELHIPERALVTGSLIEDAKRYDLVRDLADGLRSLFILDWRSAEYGITTTQIVDYEVFWHQYKEDLFRRLGFEQIDHY